MFIVCSGPDTYHARKKAQELVDAFRAKHDPSGYSTETLPSSDFESILNRLSAPSLFAQKRMIRCDGLLDSLKIADVRMLAKRLVADADQTILVTVEEESMSSKYEKEFEGVKVVLYPYPLLRGVKFDAAVLTRAKELGVTAELSARIAKNVDGDMWLAEQELQKCAAFAGAPLVSNATYASSVFDAAEQFIAQKEGWRTSAARIEEPGAAPSVFLSQARTYARVKDGETRGVHPYVAKKFSFLRTAEVRARRALLAAIHVLVSSRQGMSSTGEEDVLYK